MRRGAILLAVLVAGCGSAAGGPGSGQHRLGSARAPAGVARAQRSHEYASPPAPQPVAGAFSTPVRAVTAFAHAYINWSATTVTDRLHLLADISVGQARAAMSLAAAQTAHDYELHRGGVANSGTVEAVAALPERSTQYVVVTRERTTATATNAYQGLKPAWHVTLATVTRVAGVGWVLDSWQPEN